MRNKVAMGRVWRKQVKVKEGKKGKVKGKARQVFDVAPEPVTPQAATSAARALQISLRTLTELPKGEWAGAVQTAYKQAKLDTLPRGAT